jgi:hypothetical protein
MRPPCTATFDPIILRYSFILFRFCGLGVQGPQPGSCSADQEPHGNQAADRPRLGQARRVAKLRRTALSQRNPAVKDVRSARQHVHRSASL